jgi:hypothetical protein
MMKYGLLLCVLLLSAVGCPGQQDNQATTAAVNVKLELEPTPPKVGIAELALTLSDSSGDPLAGANLQVEGNMNHAGMKPVFADLKETKPGRYTGRLEFTMGGDWFLLVTGQLADGRRVNEKVDVPGVKRP